MEINIIRLRTVLDGRENEVIKNNNAFIDAINDELLDDDLMLVEDSLHAAYDLFFVETGGSEEQFIKYFDNTVPVAEIICLVNCNSKCSHAFFRFYPVGIAFIPPRKIGSTYLNLLCVLTASPVECYCLTHRRQNLYRCYGNRHTAP